MRSGVLSDSYIEEFCKDFRPFPLDKAPEFLKIEHPQNPYSGIKPIYNQTVVRPETINAMVANVHRANQKAGDLTSDHEELLNKVSVDISQENEVSEAIATRIINEAFEEALGELAGQDVDLPEAFLPQAPPPSPVSLPRTPPSSPTPLTIPPAPPIRGGAREGSGRMTSTESGLKLGVEATLPFKEKITKKQVKEAILYSGGDIVEATGRLSANVKEESAKKVLEGIMKRVEKEIERKEKAK